MSSTDIILRFSYPPAESNSDLRTFSIFRIYEGSTDQVELYKFYQPSTSMPIGVTTFSRKNTNTSKWETAGEIEWSSHTNATVHFGIDEVPMRELRKPKNHNSKSRRFKASGNEYKWKQGEEGNDLFCVDSRGRKVATWTEKDLTLRVEQRVEGILDRIVVTCLLNRWMKGQNAW